jgi:glycosyltransferase involved in cell wall biosynthesis
MKIAIMVRGFLQTPVPNDIAYSPATVAQTIAEGLQARGHNVTFFGPQGTHVKTTALETCSLRPIAVNMADFDAAVSTTDLFKDYRFGLYDTAMAREMLRRARSGEFDCVVFNHFESVLPLAPLFQDVPIIHILHDYMDQDRCETLSLHSSPNQYFVSISDSQRRDAPDLNYSATIPNGINLETFSFDPAPEDYLFFSGRITHTKGVREAVQVALQANKRLLIAGSLSKQDYWYFDEYVKPYLSDKILFLGMLGHEQIAKYYQKAAAVLMPIQWQEPFGLSMVEAGACGTPVIAFNRGSVPEIIKDGKTGFIVDNSAEMIMAIDKLGKIRRRDCTEHIKKHFTDKIMVNEYERVLEETILQHRQVGRKSVRNPSLLSEKLLKLSKRIKEPLKAPMKSKKRR